MKRKPAAVIHQRHHRRGGGIVFLRAFGGFGRENIAARVAAKPLQAVDVGMNGSLPHNPHQRAVVGFVQVPFAARAAVSGIYRLQRNPDLTGARVIVCAR